MIANYLYRFSSSTTVLDLIASRRKRGISAPLQLSAGPGYDHRRPPRHPQQHPTTAPTPSPLDLLQAEIDALEDPERWDGLA